MDDLVRWLRDQFDEDERAAKARRGIFPSPGVDEDGAIWLHVRPGGNAVIVRYADPVAGYDDMTKLRDWANEKIGWTQERVLREIDAKRRQLARIVNHATLMGRGEIHGDLLRSLAMPYADRPGYREKWRP